METIAFNRQDIEVKSVFFSQNDSQLRFESFPRKLVYKGREYLLVES